MAVTKTPFAPDSAAELHDLIGEDTTATFESDPKFIDSNPTYGASSEHVEVQRDTDDTGDSEEEEEELEEEDDDDLEEEDDDEDEDEDDDEDEDEDEEEEDFDHADEEEEVGVLAIQATGSTNLRGPVVNGNKSVESALEEDDDAGDESVDEDEYVIEGGDDETDSSDNLETDRAIDAALRMSALATVTSEYAANI